uniref:Uncharacterized protein n=1 Tax=Picea glauca TaxID=3330 RepID=A0A101LVD1_PICGL|nr:hypothetical protein ABT39_MTgene2152 [Picea glauca]QHR87215.1 hypothetical protein Q903MT_gene1224 [Picea sitchensis]
MEKQESNSVVQLLDNLPLSKLASSDLSSDRPTNSNNCSWKYYSGGEWPASDANRIDNRISFMDGQVSSTSSPYPPINSLLSFSTR